MDSSLVSLRNKLQDALDEIVSLRTTENRRNEAFSTLEGILATACLSGSTHDRMENLLALQYTFECNVPARLVAWISASTPRLELLTDKGCVERERVGEITSLSSHLSLSLSLIQGFALCHPTSKSFLGRRYALEVFLDLLLASRHLAASSADLTASESKTSLKQPSMPSTSLSSVVIDTLLCVLVDSSPALRAFEESDGLQVVVKILKRAGTPREVRMKCLEFLYFYLLDEDMSSSTSDICRDSEEPNLPPTAPATPQSEDKRSISPVYPASSYGSSTYAFSTNLSSGSSSRSVSSSSTSSFSSTSSNMSSSTAASTAASTSSFSEEEAILHTPQTLQPPPANKQLQARPLMMLRKELDFIPLSPKKAQVAELGKRPLGSPSKPSTSRHGPGKSMSRTRSKLGQDFNRENERRVVESPKSKELVMKRTINEKKEFLGTMLGNVDALVESVRKAGVWGLG